MILRDYQQRAYNDTRSAVIAGHRCVCIVLPTGSGKTRLAVAIITARNHRCLWLSHRAELLDQARDTILAAGAPAVSVLRATDPRIDPSAAITVASIPTLHARPDVRPDARIIVVDECHHVSADTWREVLSAYPDAIILGLTATPQRSDGSPLGDVFTSLVVGASYSELTSAGHLIEPEVIAPPKRLTRAVAEDPAQAYLTHGRGMPALVFTATVAESIACTESLRMAGVRAAHIDGTTRGRAAIIEAFRSGALDVLCSCGVLTEGFDAPRAACCVLARPCGSELVFLQIVGRILRPPGPALLLDLVGAVHEHGWPTEDRAYSLSGTPIGRASKQEVTIWQCTACGHCQPTAPVRRRCPRCGSLMPEPEPLRNARLKLERQARNARATIEDQRAALASLTKRERAAGRSPWRAVHIFKARYGRTPTYDEKREAGLA